VLADAHAFADTVRPIDRNALTSDGFLILVDLTRSLQITAHEFGDLLAFEAR
jgi:hypothetical protein